MVFSVLLLLFQLSSQPSPCVTNVVSETSFSVSYLNSSLKIETSGRSPRVLACDVWKEDPAFIKVLVEFGFSGTTKMSQPTYLYIFKKEDSSLVKKFEYIVKTRLETGKAQETKVVEFPAEMRLNEGRVEVLLPNIKEIITIDDSKLKREK